MTVNCLELIKLLFISMFRIRCNATKDDIRELQLIGGIFVNAQISMWNFFCYVGIIGK